MEVKLRDQVGISMLPTLYAQYWEDSRNGRLVPDVEVYRKRLVEEAYDWADMVVKI